MAPSASLKTSGPLVPPLHLGSTGERSRGSGVAETEGFGGFSDLACFFFEGKTRVVEYSRDLVLV